MCLCANNETECPEGSGACCDPEDSGCCDYLADTPSGLKAAYECYSVNYESCCIDGPCQTQPVTTDFASTCTSAGCCDYDRPVGCGAYPDGDCCSKADDEETPEHCCELPNGGGQCCAAFQYCCDDGCHAECT
jgi:hypothetical protein